MDPKQALIDALRHLASGDHTSATECLETYWEWINKGGFEPQFTGAELANTIGLAIELKDAGL